MSWKPVELQIALPRTVENSRNQQILQQQAQQQNMIDADNIAQQALRTEHTVLEAGENARAELRDRQEREAAERKERRAKDRWDEEEEEAPHPFKGHRLDIKM